MTQMMLLIILAIAIGILVVHHIESHFHKKAIDNMVNGMKDIFRNVHLEITKITEKLEKKPPQS